MLARESFFSLEDRGTVLMTCFYKSLEPSLCLLLDVAFYKNVRFIVLINIVKRTINR